jgi:hypothetical protein
METKTCQTTSKAQGSTGAAATGFSFLQISDSHVGFNKPANPDALGTLKEAIGKVNGLLAKQDRTAWLVQKDSNF